MGPIMVVSGAAGLAAAFALTIEKLRLLEDPTYVPLCSFDAVLSCSSIMTSDQAEAFGFPNPLLGIAGFSGVLALGIASVSGAALARWVWLTIQGGLTFAVVFVHWLFTQSVYDIKALCPFCMIVWVATITAFLYVTLQNLLTGRLAVPARLQPGVDLAARYHSVLLILWFAVLAIQIAVAFWDHWQTLL